MSSVDFPQVFQYGGRIARLHDSPDRVAATLLFALFRPSGEPDDYGSERQPRRPQEDEVAIDRVLDGDTAAFAVVVHRWQGPLVNLAYRFCRDRGRAEDMAQEAFLQAFRGLRSWRRDAAFSTWLFALATNVYRTEMRRMPSKSMSMDEIVMTTRSMDESRSESDRRTLVQKALRSLPPKYRDPLVLFYFHEQDVAMTAKSLALPEGTVKARLSRARALLKSKLADRL